MEKVYCEKCKYLDCIPVDGPAMREFRCKKIKTYEEVVNPIKFKQKLVFCDPYIDNKDNMCDSFEEKKKFLKNLFSWDF